MVYVLARDTVILKRSRSKVGVNMAENDMPEHSKARHEAEFQDALRPQTSSTIGCTFANESPGAVR